MPANVIDEVTASMVIAKAVCAICGHEEHSLIGHLRDVHGITKEEYLAKYPGKQLISELGKVVYERILKREDIASTAAQTDFMSVETFGVGFGTDGKVSKPIKGYSGFTEADGVPGADPNYIFPADVTRDVLMGMSVGARIYASGPTGSGKTTLFEQIANRLGRPFWRQQFHKHMEPVELLGTWTVGSDGAMQYLYSGFVEALRKPAVICLDEFDSGNPGCTAIANAILERKPLVLSNKAGELVVPHPDSIIVATGNTTGMGDETGLYTSTDVQSYATMNRFGMHTTIGYLAEAVEIDLLRRIYPKMPTPEINDMVKTANLIRDGFVGGKITCPISTRQLIAWGQWMSMTGKPRRAFDLSFANAINAQDRKVVDELYQRVYGKR